MVTIQAPGIEINEIDLSFYDFPGPREETTNVYVTGFAAKGLNYTPYKFTSDNTAQDIIDTFGVPSNEAERYFYNACVEVIEKKKTVLYASRLPYANKALSTVIGAEYCISSVGSISSDYEYYLGMIPGEFTSKDDLISTYYNDDGEKVEQQLATIELFGKLGSKRTFFFTDFDVLNDISGYDVIGSDWSNLVNVSADTKHIIDFNKSNISVSTFNGDIGNWKQLSGTVLDSIAGADYEFRLLDPVAIENSEVKMYTPCYFRVKYGGIYGNKFGEIYTEDNTIKKAAKLEFTGLCAYTTDTIELFRTGERKPAVNKFMIIDKTQAQYEEVPVDQFHKGNNQQLIGILPVVTTAANALYYQKMIDVDEDDAQQLANYEALGWLHSTKSEDVVTGKIKWENALDPELSSQTIENAYLYAEHVRNSDTQEIESKIWNNLLVTGTNSEYYANDNKNAETLSKTATSMFPWIGKNDVGEFDREYMKHIGVVVFKGYLDSEEGNKINYKPVEAFAGTLKPGVLNSVTGKSMFIDEVINTNSKYIEFYSNCFNNDDNNFYTWDNNVQDKTCEEQQQEADPKQSLVFRSTLFGAAPDTSADTKIEDGMVITDGGECEISATTYNKATYDLEVLNGVKDPTNKGTYNRPGQLNGVIYDDIDILIANRLDAPVFGFKKYECLKIINVAESITKALDKCFQKTANVNAKQIDIVLDAGVSNIAQFYTTCNCPTGIFFMDEDDPDRGWYSVLADEYEGHAANGRLDSKDKRFRVALNYNPVSPTAVKNWKLEDAAHTKRWQLVLRKFDNFCKNVRKDCMFIADGLRPLCLKGNAKIVRPTNYKSTIGNSIAPRMKYMAGAVDTSYGAGYCDWMLKEDEFTGLNFWLPPSIKACGVYINSTNNGHYWDAPAGINRGKINVKDIAFNPTVYEGANFYTKSWNYCTWYEDEGHVIEGQRTFQSRPTAFDRVNVRRLFLYLERKVFLAGRYFLYEGNTAYTRQRLIDTLTPYFEDAKINGGCYDYRIICDETNNTDDTIDRNELHIKIGIKPVKSIEFIDATFVCLRTGGSWSEAGF